MYNAESIFGEVDSEETVDAAEEVFESVDEVEEAPAPKKKAKKAKKTSDGSGSPKKASNKPIQTTEEIVFILNSYNAPEYETLTKKQTRVAIAEKMSKEFGVPRSENQIARQIMTRLTAAQQLFKDHGLVEVGPKDHEVYSYEDQRQLRDETKEAGVVQMEEYSDYETFVTMCNDLDVNDEVKKELRFAWKVWFELLTSKDKPESPRVGQVKAISNSEIMSAFGGDF